MAALFSFFNPNGDTANGNGTAIQNVAAKTVAETGTTITFSSAHYGTIIAHTNASATTLTLNKAAPVGTWFQLVQLGAGAVTIAVESGGTRQARGSKYKTAGQYAQAFGVVLANSDGNSAVWYLAGDLTT